jgi:hypothetical protein
MKGEMESPSEARQLSVEARQRDSCQPDDDDRGEGEFPPSPSRHLTPRTVTVTAVTLDSERNGRVPAIFRLINLKLRESTYRQDHDIRTTRTRPMPSLYYYVSTESLGIFVQVGNDG